MYAMKKQYEYARHDETGHSHFSRVVQKGVNKGTKVGCKYGACEDARNSPIPPFNTSKWWYREILCYSMNPASPPLPQDFLARGGKPSVHPKRKKPPTETPSAKRPRVVAPE